MIVARLFRANLVAFKSREFARNLWSYKSELDGKASWQYFQGTGNWSPAASRTNKYLVLTSFPRCLTMELFYGSTGAFMYQNKKLDGSTMKVAYLVWFDTPDHD